jgi:tetratricopeptide (TPR) repeat protein
MLGRGSEALEDFIEAEPFVDGKTKEDLYSNRGALYVLRGKNNEAVADLQKCLELNPNNANACNTLAVALSDLKQHEEACKMIKRAIEIEPHGMPILYFDAGHVISRYAKDSCKTDKGKASALYEEAIMYLAKGIEFDSYRPEIHSKMAFCLLNVEKYNEAAHELVTAAGLEGSPYNLVRKYLDEYFSELCIENGLAAQRAEGLNFPDAKKAEEAHGKICEALEQIPVNERGKYHGAVREIADKSINRTKKIFDLGEATTFANILLGTILRPGGMESFLKGQDNAAGAGHRE